MFAAGMYAGSTLHTSEGCERNPMVIRSERPEQDHELWRLRLVARTMKSLKCSTTWRRLWRLLIGSLILLQFVVQLFSVLYQ